MSACLFANLSFFICLCAACFSEMAVSKVKMMELSELRSYSFPGSMHIVFHLQFNLPSSSFPLPMSVFVASGLYFCRRIDNNSLYNKVWMQKEGGSGVPKK